MARNRVTVYLVQRKRRLKGGAVGYYYLRWFAADGREQMVSLGQCSKFTKAEAKAARAQMEEKVNGGQGPSRGGLTLGEFREKYKQERLRPENEARIRRTSERYAKVDAKTIGLHDMVLRSLIEHFGEDFRLGRIDKPAAVGWYEALRAGKLIGVRSASWGKDQKLAENTLRSKVRTVKTIFRWAIEEELIAANPFDTFAGAGLRRKRPNPQVSLETFRAVCAVAPVHWRAMLGLCRLAALRRGEALALPWSATEIDTDDEEMPVGVDWDRKRLSVVIGKGDRYREVPIGPELMAILLEAFEKAPDGTERIVHPITANNIDRDMRKLIKAAGIRQWKKPFQALRSSCENDWKVKGIDRDTREKWSGHSEEVAKKYYLAPTDSEFDRVTEVDPDQIGGAS